MRTLSRADLAQILREMVEQWEGTKLTEDGGMTVLMQRTYAHRDRMVKPIMLTVGTSPGEEERDV